MFNVQGSELIFLLLVALIILGPEKLPDAVRRATKTYAEFKKMASGFQGEMRQVLDEPMRELRETANAVRDAASFDITASGDAAAAPPAAGKAAVSEIAPQPKPPVRREPGLNFGSANPRRQERTASTDETLATEAPAAPAPTASDAPAASDTPAASDGHAAPADAPADPGSAEGDTTE